MPGDEKKKPEEQQDNNEPEKKQDDVKPTDTDTNPEDKPEDKPAGDDGKKEEPEKKEEKPTEEPSDKDQGDENGEGADVPPADTPPVANDKPAADSVNLELLNTKAQLAAIKSGIRVDVVEDAVCLAMHDAKKNGELTEESVAEALSGVLSRHPEWKNTPENTNNFRVGGDGSKENPSSNEEISKIFGNV